MKVIKELAAIINFIKSKCIDEAFVSRKYLAKYCIYRRRSKFFESHLWNTDKYNVTRTRPFNYAIVVVPNLIPHTFYHHANNPLTTYIVSGEFNQATIPSIEF
ncbi:hypothetical protein N9Y89_00645 [bacterium]|nr:hypothetical protein [bacterium]